MPLPTVYATYRQGLLQRQLKHEAELAQRFDQAWVVAKRAATWLERQFGLKQVWIFGSLVHQQWFSPTSDIDLAVEELHSDAYLTAVACLQDLAPEFKIDLIRLDRCPPDFREAIVKEGQCL
jgi:predicted nucleotidyltransferase